MAVNEPAIDRVAVENFQERVFEAALGTFATYALHLGSRLGYYDALAADGPSTPTGPGTASSSTSSAKTCTRDRRR